jgi:hypothetical protein
MKHPVNVRRCLIEHYRSYKVFKVALTKTFIILKTSLSVRMEVVRPIIGGQDILLETQFRKRYSISLIEKLTEVIR